PADQVQANAYNPNKVATPEMKLLHTSIKLDGYTQPIVAYKLDDDKYEVVDGFHRSRVGKEYKDINERVHGFLPVVVIDKPIDERM
uniref:IbrB-like domain-containing protein n=1 Tax=Streptococcus sobrinus TaxID=1310 RepID=UPI000377ECA4